MPASPPVHLIAYFSLSGTTSQVAGWIRDRLNEAGHLVGLVDLTFPGCTVKSQAPSSEEADCLWVLSPVYSMHPAPAVLDYLGNLDPAPGRLAVAVATYGVVCSGVALPDMGGLLQDKGYRLAGAAKVVTEHSMMWTCDSPLGQGRPDARDREQVWRLADRVAGLMDQGGDLEPLSLQALDYQPAEIRAMAAQRNVMMLQKMLPPITLDTDLCDECGLCAEQCCQGNITLAPRPVFGDNCLVCLKCLRACLTGALGNPVLKKLESELPARAKSFGEPAVTRLFLPGSAG